jgi:hypothetical protein
MKKYKDQATGLFVFQQGAALVHPDSIYRLRTGVLAMLTETQVRCVETIKKHGGIRLDRNPRRMLSDDENPYSAKTMLYDKKEEKWRNSRLLDPGGDYRTTTVMSLKEIGLLRVSSRSANFHVFDLVSGVRKASIR